MDSNTIWQAAITLTGLGGVACFLVWSLYKQWLSLPIFSKLTKAQTFQLLKLFLILTFVFALSALIIYAIEDNPGSNVIQNTECGPAINNTDRNVTITGNYDCKKE